jgi:hypothetical protein
MGYLINLAIRIILCLRSFTNMTPRYHLSTAISYLFTELLCFISSFFTYFNSGIITCILFMSEFNFLRSHSENFSLSLFPNFVWSWLDINFELSIHDKTRNNVLSLHFGPK